MKQIRSDIILDNFETNGVEASRYIDNLHIFKKSKYYKLDSFEIKTEKDAEKIGRQIGKYRLLEINDIKALSKVSKTKIKQTLSEIISSLLPKLNVKDNVLVVGLGNEEIESDSLGCEVANKVIITRLQNNLSFPKLCAITPSVMGITGIETADIVSGIVAKIKPKLVVIVDSLCASSYNRLGRSIQVTNTSIVPGGGINNPKKILNKELLGCDIITIGVPLMIYATDLCECNNIEKNLIVTYHDIKFVVNELSSIIACAINLAILGIEYV